MEGLAIVLVVALGVVSVALVILRRSNARLFTEVEQLRPFQTVMDAEERARQILSDAGSKGADELRRAQDSSTRLQAEAKAALAAAERSAAEAQQRATNELRAARSRAEAVVAEARGDAAKIVQDANDNARQIAGDAIDAMNRAREFEQVAKAMKNVIEGYGDQYIIPSHSLLDDLAEEFGFAEAGQKLKAARERVRSMVKSRVAADCDYVEANRRDTAIMFVVDAFNGKVDTSLARAKDDNFGTLRQEILDAFTLVNANGAAFRNARILPTYRDARVEELQWATVAQELKLREREEQRAIKERIREEERAQREFERAMKEVAKEEEMLRKAMEKVQKQVAQATEEERAKYEAQLQELSARLVEAEAKAQRALSMAQQTKSGHVYVISNIGSFGEHVYKIGMTRRLEPLDRVKELGDASVPFEFDVHAMIHSEDAPSLEHELHKRFVRAQVNKVNARKEFFKVPLGAIRAEVDKLSINAKWTLAAEARQYKETLAIEAAMDQHQFDEAAWAERQLEAMDDEEMEAIEA